MTVPVRYVAQMIRTVLDATPFPRPAEATRLLLGTAACESGFRAWRQIGRGHALGLFQMEPVTESSHWGWLRENSDWRHLITTLTDVRSISAEQLWRNLPYQILMARLHYYLRDPDPMPEVNDIEEAARRYKQYYNTPAGKGSVAKYLTAYRILVVPVLDEEPAHIRCGTCDQCGGAVYTTPGSWEEASVRDRCSSCGALRDGDVLPMLTPSHTERS